jgi:hypothetical protein
MESGEIAVGCKFNAKCISALEFEIEIERREKKPQADKAPLTRLW